MKDHDYTVIAQALREARSFAPSTQAAADFNCGVSTATRRVLEVLQHDARQYGRTIDGPGFLRAAGMQ